MLKRVKKWRSASLQRPVCLRPYRQHTGASLGELEAFVPEQMRDFTEEEKQAVEKGIETIEAICKERGYHLPELDGIVFARSTMEEECGAGAYTHGTEIYLGEWILDFAMSGELVQVQYFNSLLAHELFHCLTRSHPEFREAMYGILGFTVTEKDYEFGPDVLRRHIWNGQ